MSLVAIRLSERGFVRYYDPNGLELNAGDICIVEDRQAAEVPGQVCTVESRSSWQLRGRTYPRVLRKAEESEIEQWRQLKQREMEAIALCKQKARELNLEMKISTVHFDDRQRRVVFYFTADQRVDFRQLVKELAAALRARIELWQVGVRDEARMVHGFGICGKELCCGAWIQEFQPVSIRQAKDQDLLLSPAKLSGMCGRLRCCLTYEHEQYKAAMKEAPGVGAICRCKGLGTAIVMERSLLRRQATVRDDYGALRQIPFSDVEEVLGKAPASAMKQDGAARVSAPIAPASSPELTGQPPEERGTASFRELEDMPAPKPQPQAPLHVVPESDDEAKAQTAKPGRRRGRRRRGRASGAPAAAPQQPAPQRGEPGQGPAPVAQAGKPAQEDRAGQGKSKARFWRGRRSRRNRRSGQEPKAQ